MEVSLEGMPKGGVDLWRKLRTSATAPGVEVEIDESKFGRQKYHSGRYVEDHCVFVGTERLTGSSFLVEVKKRDANTLASNYIHLGSVIFYDEWRAYNVIEDIDDGEYTHQTVNHSKNFVDPNTGAHTQSVKSVWSHCGASVNAWCVYV